MPHMVTPMDEVLWVDDVDVPSKLSMWYRLVDLSVTKQYERANTEELTTPYVTWGQEKTYEIPEETRKRMDNGLR